MTQITKKISVGKRQIPFDLEISADVSGRHGQYNIENYDLTILRKGKILTGKRFQIVNSRIDSEGWNFDIDLIDEFNN